MVSIANRRPNTIARRGRCRSSVAAGAAAALADPLPGGDCSEKKSLARSVEHEHFAMRINRAVELKTPPEPGRGRCEKRIDAAVGGIARELRQMRGQHRTHEIRNGVLRLAHGQGDRRLARLHIGQQIVEPRKGRACVGRPGRGQNGHVWLGHRNEHWNRAPAAKSQHRWGGLRHDKPSAKRGVKSKRPRREPRPLDGRGRRREAAPNRSS